MRHLQVVYLSIQYQDCHQQLTWQWKPSSTPLVDSWMTCSPRRLAPISSTTSHWRGSSCLSLPCMMGQVIYSTIRCISDNWWRWILVMTLDIGNDVLFCKVFLTCLHGSILFWFHRLLLNSINSFQDVSKTFVGYYLFYSIKVEHKHPAEHQDAGKWITEGLHEAIRTSSAPSGVL